MSDSPHWRRDVTLSLLPLVIVQGTATLTRVWILTALPVGFLFGLLLQKGDLCGASAFSEVVLARDTVVVPWPEPNHAHGQVSPSDDPHQSQGDCDRSPATRPRGEERRRGRRPRTRCRGGSLRQPLIELANEGVGRRALLVFEAVNGRPFCEFPPLDGPDVAAQKAGDRLPTIQPFTSRTIRQSAWHARSVEGLGIDGHGRTHSTSIGRFPRAAATSAQHRDIRRHRRRDA
jgi:hypothetical protein